MRMKFKKFNFLCWNELPEMSKGMDLFNILSSYLKTRGLSWKDYFGTCTDGSLSKVGSMKGFASLVEQQNPDIISAHCFLHREVLISKSLGNELKRFLMMLQQWSTYRARTSSIENG